MIVIMTLYKTLNTVINIESYVHAREKGVFKGMCHRCLRLSLVGKVYSGNE